ncbi:hypothetical protein ACFFS2_00040 [Streptomyces aurantiacus]|uniref:Uncharacterized protein n=1 Tax=Streptomyces aurantiacus TaxID=47760 RepID=A0A7G1NUI4_9ACTN|nr:hypothetical protein [Streptomyces aurantiacus]BCL26818.1 hypothetical protein GCM10017557_16770 [Streptomyces aurantiacus]
MTEQPQDQTQDQTRNQTQDQAQQGQSQQGEGQAQSQSRQTPWNPFGALEQVGLLVLGAVDLALDQVRQAADRSEGAVRRSDLRELVTDGVQDLKVRGELAARRVTAADSENYLELMARRAGERKARTVDAARSETTVPSRA